MSIHTIEHCRIADEIEKTAYERGAEDMRKAVCALFNTMRVQDAEDVFKIKINGISYITDIFNGTYSANDIIEKVKKWQEEKEKQTFKVGDEVEHSDHRNGSCNKYIVIKADSDSNVLWLLDLRTFLRIWIYKDDSSLKKTGKHFDTIDIPEGGATI